MNTKFFIALGALVLVGGVGYLAYAEEWVPTAKTNDLDPTPRNVTLSGTYTCLPHLGSGPQTMECAFGLRADNGDYYAVNFGASAGAMEQFQSGEHVTAEGFVVIKEALSSDQWAKYNMKGIFTVTRVLSSAPSASQKIDINAVCEGALVYMTFPNGAATELFLSECKEGKHPEVMERYKAELNLESATI
jgi:hypothetical protein